MIASDLIKTVYLGDRACKGINIISWEKRVKIHINCISRIRSASGNWEFYTDEDILDGKIVFVGVEEISFTPPGLLPNDLIQEFILVKTRPDGMFEFKVQMDSVTPKGNAELLTIFINAAGFHLEDPVRPGQEIIS